MAAVVTSVRCEPVHFGHGFVGGGHLQRELAERGGQFILPCGGPAHDQAVGRRIELDRQILHIGRAQRGVHGRYAQFIDVVAVHAHDLFRYRHGLLEFLEGLVDLCEQRWIGADDESAGDCRGDVFQVADGRIEHASGFGRIDVLQFEHFDFPFDIQPQFLLHLLDQLIEPGVVLGAAPDQQLVGALAGEDLHVGQGGGDDGGGLGAGALGISCTRSSRVASAPPVSSIFASAAWTRS